jgi:hypothetical protein
MTPEVRDYFATARQCLADANRLALQLAPTTISRWQWLSGPKHKTVSGGISSPLTSMTKANKLKTARRIKSNLFDFVCNALKTIRFAF